MKATDKNASKEVTDPARKEIEKAKNRIQRIDQILAEAHRAEVLFIKQQRR